MLKYFICNNLSESHDLIEELIKAGSEFIESKDIVVEPNSITKLSLDKLVDSIKSANNAIVSDKDINPRTGFELGVLISSIDIRELPSRLWIRGESNEIYKELIRLSQFKNLKYRCFDMSRMTWKDYVFIGALHGHSTIVGYGKPTCDFDKCIFSRIFYPSEVMDIFGEKLKEKNYKLDPNSYDSFRRIPSNIMIPAAIN